MFTEALLVAFLSTAVRACTGTISSLTDVTAASACTTINVNSFTVPAGQTFALTSLLAGTTINILGDITFGEKVWAGPLFSISIIICIITGDIVTVNGNGHTFNGNGQFYWNLKVLNSPAQAFSIDNSAPLIISGITIDDSLGDQANSMSGGAPAGANTDGFDVGNQAPLTISNCTVKNQDDCVAINSGTNVIFTGNHCSGGHGISIGSIDTGDIVSNITISNNVITSGANGLRIKTVATATSATVSGVTYSGNTVSGVTQFGLLIDQSYPATLGTPGSGVIISGINFVGTNTFTIASGVVPVAVNCGSGSCQGTWNWSGLKTSGGAANKINYSGITGYSG
ncbi:polygalacturonase [Mycena pura]|uniref:endo-polygalacturonase n=1 Tax=Mycena pura TaxID=153505 RepID=A0AAD6VIK4_9AGAR|nr:polygalacturonase [Mycena pura]